VQQREGWPLFHSLSNPAQTSPERKIMYTIWYCDADGIVRSFECDTIIYAQAVWDTLVLHQKTMLSARP
jgi:hypothetical protein